MRDVVVRGFTAGGHSVRSVDLYADTFDPVMRSDEHRKYMDFERNKDSQIVSYISMVQESDILVFVYPTWWGTLPAMLKGWLERVLVPGVGFTLNSRNKVRPGLCHVKRIVGVTTYGSPRSYVRLMADGGRRTLHRSLRAATGLRTRANWFALYGIDGASHEKRREFLTTLERKVARF